MTEQYITYYEFGDGSYSNIACYTRANESTPNETDFFENVAYAIVGMKKHTGYDVTRVVFEGTPLKWRVTDIEFSGSILITFTNFHTGQVVHSVSAPW